MPLLPLPIVLAASWASWALSVVAGALPAAGAVPSPIFAAAATRCPVKARYEGHTPSTRVEKGRALTDENQSRLLVSSLKFGQSLLHVTLQIPIGLLWSDIREIEFLLPPRFVCCENSLLVTSDVCIASSV